MYLPDGLLTLGEVKHDVDVNPHIIAPDPFSSDDCLNAFPPIYLSLLTTTEDNTMNTSENEPSSGLNGRLRPRKLTVLSSQSQKTVRKSEGRSAQDKHNRTSASTPSKASQNIPDDLTNKSDFSPNPHFLCPYCDKKFASKQTVSNHARRMHVSASSQDSFSGCLFCNHVEPDPNDIIRHMVDSHPNQYFACFDCHARFSSTLELDEHKLNVCEKQKVSYRSKLRQKVASEAKKSKKSLNIDKNDEFPNNVKEIQDSHEFNGVVISCELKPPQVRDEADIEDNITTNLILPPSKIIGNSAVIEKSAVIVLDDLQWNKRIPPNFSFHNSDADQILSRLGVVHRSPRTGESTKRDWSRNFDDSTQKFEKCFDTSFYTKVASNVQENLTKFLDGSFNFNPDPDSMIKTRKSKNSVVINTAEGFPILLAGSQFSRSVFDGYLPRGIAPKHKWKWDNLESEKILVNPDQIKRDSHTNNCIITLISSLDTWTQLCMRRKFEEKFSSLPLEKKTEKQNIIGKELKEILESREIPTSSQVVRYTSKPTQSSVSHDFPASLGLTPSVPGYDLQPAILSGEWVRPRCYVCCACGAQSRNPRALSSHIATQHPNAQVQHYEIVGEPLLNADILKHLYVPPNQMCNRTRPLRGFRECTKCRKSVTLEDLHQHMLDCAGDTPTVRRRQCRYRPFGVRKRRPRLPDNTIRKKIRKDIRSRHRRQKNRLRSRPRIRTEVGDAETIRKMIADLPAKRHRVMVNPMNQNSRPRPKLDKQRNKIIIKKHSSEELRKHPTTKCFKSSLPEESTSYDTPSNNLSGKEDDDDNKPLRPKVTRTVVKRKRRSESVKKNVVVNRARRKSLRVKENKASVKHIEKLVEHVSRPEIEEISMGHSSQRIEINRESYKVREHGNRSGSNSRDEQRPGCSDSNSDSNNSVVPTQNVPLKHSIASLTANSETHDKSVQFHHLFLVQQECNNTNQSVTGQPTLFENEAAVARLDKPPLNCSQKSQLDLYFYQKNKLSKPRKGLNDCIAMLKNKLVDPAPEIERISVQCGTDDLIDLDFQEINQKKDNEQSRIDIKSRPQNEETSYRKVAHELSEESNCQTDIIMQSTDDLCHQNSTELEQFVESGHDISSQQEPLSKENEIKRKSSRIKSVTHPQCLPTQKDPIKVSVDNEISPQKSTETGILELTVSSPQKLHSRRSSNHQSEILSECNLNKPQVPDDCVLNDLSQTKSPASSQIDLTWRNPLDFSPTNCVINEQTVSVAYVQSNFNGQNQADCRTKNNMTPKENDILTERSFTCKQPTDVFTACNLSDIPFDIPPAHASTNVESILSAPLDLSGTSNTKDQSNQESMICSYDSYGTLDLSNKSLDKGLRKDITMINDEVVDLRIMPSQLEYHPTTIDLCVKQMNNITDASRSTDNMATDLSMRGIDDSESSDLSGRRVEDDLVSTTKLNESEHKQIPVIELFNKDCPTDLSSIEEKRKTDQSLLGNNEIDPIIRHDSSIKCFGKVNHDNHSDLPTDLQTTSTKQATPVTNNATEHKKMQEGKASKSMPSRVIDQSAIQIQKPVYDPILKIPQYKMRPVATRATTSSLAGSTDDRLCRSSSVIVTVTNAIHSKSPQDDLFSYTKAATENTIICTSISTATEPISVYNLTPRVISSSACKLESTTPVYTLANACISVTKIEQPVSSTLTSSLLNVPGTTIANTTSVYTLAGPTIGATKRYNYKSDVSPIPPAEAQSFLSTTHDRFIEEENTTKVNQEQKNKDIRNHDFGSNLYQDPEIARKVAMLPKELVEILGNMPIDHRNQLLNILPQYVSTPASTSVSQCESTHTATNSSALLPNEAMSTASANKETLDNNIVPTTDIQPTLRQSPNTDQPSSEVNSQYDIDRKQTIPLFLSTSPFLLPLDKGNTNEDVISLPVRALSSSNDSDQFVEATTNISLNINECSDDRIIDLTDDENLPLATETVTVAEDLSCPIKLSSQKVPGYINVGKSRQKGNSDQTASLRAVRIKTPSERHKKNELVKNTSEQISKSNDYDDCEPSKPAESNKSLAIQQAEISSTQHTNKNTAIDSKFNTINLPREFDSNAEGTIVTPQLISTLTDGFEIKIDKDSNATIGNSINQSILTDSVPIIQLSSNKSSDEYSPDNTVNENPQNASNSSIIFNQKSTKELYDESRKQELSTSKSYTDKNTEVTESKLLKIPIQIPKAEDHIHISKRNDKNSISDDEDSEDDISLAVIIKQKQSEARNVADKISQCNKSTPKSKKRKQNKVKTNVTKDISSKQHITESDVKSNYENYVSTECNDMSCNDVTCDQSVKKSLLDSQPKAGKNLKTMDNNIRENTKTKSTKNKRNIRTIGTTKQDLQSVDKEINIVGKKDNSSTASEINSSTTNSSKNQGFKPNENVNQSVIAQADMVASEDYASKVEVNAKEINISESTDPVEYKLSSNIRLDNEISTNTIHDKINDATRRGKNAKSRKKKIYDRKNTNMNCILKNKCKQDEKEIEGFPESNITEQNEKNISLNKSENQVLHVSSESDDTYGISVTSIDAIKLDSVPSTDLKFHGKEKSGCANNLKGMEVIDVDISSDLSSRRSDDKQSVAPSLRRSRRGKSLSIDSNFTEQEITVNTETSINSKGPLTKKQVIFSKLLLDEENQTKLDFTSAEQSSAITENAEDFSYNIEPHISDDSAIECAIGNFSRIKRKNSCQLERKGKKKKHVNISNCKEDDTNKMQTMNNSFLGEYSEKHYSEVSDSKIMSTDNIETTSKEHHREVKIRIDECIQLNVTEETIPIVDINKSNDGVAKVYDLPKSTRTEKRKIIHTTSFDCGLSSKPKKSKFNKSKVTEGLNVHEDLSNEKYDVHKLDVNSELRPTCYNMPVAARRTRSKSVVVKSSGDVYDPYNIDLDDMIEKTKPFRKRRPVSKERKNNSKLNATNLKSFSSNKGTASIINTDDTHLTNVFDDKQTSNSSEKNVELQIAVENNSKKSSNDNETKKPSNTVVGTDSKLKTLKPVHESVCDRDEAINTSGEGNFSDSDDSSKSDVPLKKYADKVKKVSEISNCSKKESNDRDDHHRSVSNEKPSSAIKKNKIEDCNDGELSTSIETEEQLRSEQFMESFGFFSERKPRKSNLLASKKISETFHIIANESDDIYFDAKERTTKKSLQKPNRKSIEGESSTQRRTIKKIKRSRKKDACIKYVPCYCSLCKKVFRRADNYLRHQMTLLHISKISEIEMKIKTVPVPEEPNYLIAYKEYIDRLKILTNKLTKKKKKSKIKLPTSAEILAEVHKTVREQELSRRRLSRDEALFLDCCELLKESHKNDVPNADAAALPNNVNNLLCPAESTISELNHIEKSVNDEKSDSKSDGDVDSITAKNILESEEVRNLENDLISGLKEAANVNTLNAEKNEYHTINEVNTDSFEVCTDNFSSPNATEFHYDPIEDFDVTEEPDAPKIKKHTKTMDKIDSHQDSTHIFEDKFDKIKRKCRSQAAAAKQIQTIVEPSSSHKAQKKSDKKKIKKTSKKNYHNTVLTKGALKGFDGIKVSIPTSDINLSAIVPSLKNLKKKKTSCRRKREKRDSESNVKYDSDHRAKDGSSQKKVDVYEFMDNEDAELFELRPSTLMERIKSIYNKDLPSTSKYEPMADNADTMSESASDGDDFVYMSDDYVCSDETESSLLSCEFGNVKGEGKKSSLLKRKDILEKNAVMGKIFKHNAVRCEKRSTKSKDPAKSKDNLDKLFDSLLEEDPGSVNNTDSMSSKKDDNEQHFSKSRDSCALNHDDTSSPTLLDHTSTHDVLTSPNQTTSLKKSSGTRYKTPKNSLYSQKKHNADSSKDYDYYGPSTSKGASSAFPYGPSTSKMCHMTWCEDKKDLSPRAHDDNSSNKLDLPLNYDGSSSKDDYLSLGSNEKLANDKEMRKIDNSEDHSADFDSALLFDDDTGVARQRARRKCTVGKQNVLAETWSSESEPDGAPARPKSAESAVSNACRKKKGRKKDGQQPGGRRGNRHVALKKQNFESRVTSSNRNVSSSDGDSVVARSSRAGEGVAEASAAVGVGANSLVICPPPAPVMPAPRGPGPSGHPGLKGRSRSVIFYWSSEGDEEQEHLQQHGWIVGDSHKKLVTMLAHAKGRKRNNDDKRHLVE